MKHSNPQFGQVHTLIKESRERAERAINKELIILYWSIGEYISEKISNEEWGDSVVEKLADYLQNKEPHSKGFSARNLWRMKQFYEEYENESELVEYLTLLPWSSHLHLLAKTASIQEKAFYLKLAASENYSVRELERQINRSLYQTHLLSQHTLPEKTKSDFPELLEIFKEHYVFDFLELPPKHTEDQLKKAILSQLKSFVLELGKDFVFVGQEYSLSCGASFFFVDLLFMHRSLGAIVALELKIGDFKPEFFGKLSFYLNLLDKKVKKPSENRSLGIIICQEKDLEVVEACTINSNSPILVSTYRLNIIDAGKLKSKLQLILNDQKMQRKITAKTKPKPRKAS